MMSETGHYPNSKPETSSAFNSLNYLPSEDSDTDTCLCDKKNTIKVNYNIDLIIKFGNESFKQIKRKND